ncbi:PINIT domain-containing protein, partial [Hygrophoropsis aurantiaca]
MAANDPWAEFETLRHAVRGNTVDRLKQILAGFNDQCSTLFHKTGKKQDLIDRIMSQLELWRQANNVDKWTKAQAVLHQVRTSGMYSAGRMPGAAGAQPIPQSTYPSSVARPYPSTSGSVAGRYDPYAPPRLPPPTAGPASLATASKPAMRFKPSPFFTIDQAVSSVIECPESTSATDRKQQILTFTLNSEQVLKLSSPSPKYQLRLFCTSSTFYSPSPNAFRTITGPCPIEFPPTCEVRVNSTQLSANLKGLKKKPGTAPPADLGKTVRNTGSNRVEMVYVNSQQPLQSKKFYLVVMLVEVTTVAQLVERLKKGKYRSSDEIAANMAKALAVDDDIVAGPQKMSLKCPLSFIRIRSPCRSSACVHPQCFDAESWFSVMEQTTTWLCPVCEKVLNTDELIIDGYFDQILKESPDSIEDVMVEADGQWHTPDNKYGSAAWKAAHPVIVSAKPSPPPRDSSPTTTDEESGEAKARVKKNVEILILDSDDEDEGRVTRELSVSYGSVASGSARPPPPSARSTQDDGVIDLTADSEEEGEAPPRTSTEKRKAPSGGTSPTEQIWKKSRLDSVPPATDCTQSNAMGSTLAPQPTTGFRGYPPTLPPIRLPPPPPPASTLNTSPYVPFIGQLPGDRQYRPLPPNHFSRPSNAPRPGWP